jgi:hypothetical protein
MTVIEIRPHRWGWKVFEASSLFSGTKIRQSITPKIARASVQAKFAFLIRTALLSA